MLLASSPRASRLVKYLSDACASDVLNNVGLDLPVGVDRCSAVTPLAADLDVLVKLELWVGHLISSLLPNTGFLRSPQIA